VLWAPDGSRFAVAAPATLHVMAVYTAPGGSGGGGGGGGGGVVVVEVARLPLAAATAAWADGVLYAGSTDGRLLAVLPPLLDGTGLPDAAAAAAHVSARRLAPVMVELQTTAPPPALPDRLFAHALPPARRGGLNPALAAPVLTAGGHLLVAHWVGGRATSSGAGPGLPLPGVAFSALPLAHPGLRACLALSAAAAAPTLSPADYRAAVVEAARWGAQLPPAAQYALVPHLAGLGAPAAALLLPRLPIDTVVALALAQRADVFAPLLAGVRGVDVPVAVAAVLRVLRRLSDDDVAAFGGGGSGSSGGWWPQVAAFVGVAAAALPEFEGEARIAVAALAGACRRVGLRQDALLVAAAVPPGAPAPPPVVAA
jgi:hypothetical protein